MSRKYQKIEIFTESEQFFRVKKYTSRWTAQVALEFLKISYSIQGFTVKLSPIHYSTAPTTVKPYSSSVAEN